MSEPQQHRPNEATFQMPSLRLDDRVALVTGGSRGLGLGMALALAHSGADVALAARGLQDLRAAAALIGDTKARCYVVPTDVRDVEAIGQMVSQTVDQFGRLDILVNAAGINIRKAADSITEGEWDRLLAVNLKGVFFACQAAARVMRRKGKGKIINVGSVAFEIVVPNIVPYVASKGGLRQLTRGLAIEWAADNINVNAIAPGRFWTAMTDDLFSDPASYESAVSAIPKGRPGIPADLAGATVLLASDASDYITGETIVVDGGWLPSAGTRA